MQEIKAIPTEKIEQIYTELKKLEQQAIQDLVINSDMEENFNNCSKIQNWLTHYNKWKKIQTALDTEYKKIRSIKYFSIKDVNVYTMSEKEIEKKLDSDAVMISYKNFMDAVDLTTTFVHRIQGLLNDQRFDIKNKLDYLRYLAGEDF